MTKTLTQLEKEELEAFENEFFQDNTGEKVEGYLARRVAYLAATGSDFVKIATPKDVESWLLAHDRRLIEAAFAATRVEEVAENMGNQFVAGQSCGFNAALSEVNGLKQEFLKQS